MTAPRDTGSTDGESDGPGGPVTRGTMGATRHGTWAQWHEDIHDHPKTIALARQLEELGVPEDFATDVVAGQLHRLACWALRDNGRGLVGQLTPIKFADVARWRGPRRTIEPFWELWMGSGFIDDPRTPQATIHDFRDYFIHVIRKREERAPGGRTTGGQRADNGRPMDARRADNAGTRARASRISGIPEEPLTPLGFGAGRAPAAPAAGPDGPPPLAGRAPRSSHDPPPRYGPSDVDVDTHLRDDRTEAEKARCAALKADTLRQFGSGKVDRLKPCEADPGALTPLSAEEIDRRRLEALAALTKPGEMVGPEGSGP